VSNEQARWLRHGQHPSIHNSAIRRAIYRWFWQVIDNLGGWRIQEYVSYKIALAHGDESIVYHQREVMPNCVVKLVRGKYPNPSGVPYMEHKWE
jgi:hypothetical protein